MPADRLDEERGTDLLFAGRHRACPGDPDPQPPAPNECGTAILEEHAAEVLLADLVPFTVSSQVVTPVSGLQPAGPGDALDLTP
ncbi:hypothetical protein [Streptomyces sp. NPDC002845]